MKRLGSCDHGNCKRQFEHRYRWGKGEYCVNHYYQERIESERQAAQEYERRR